MGSEWVAIVSVVSSAMVAVAGVLLPIINDARKWSRETKLKTLDAVDARSVALLKLLSAFRSGRVSEALQISSQRQGYAELLNA